MKKKRSSEGLSIGQLSSLIGMEPSAMRFYESRGLVAPDKDRGNSYRSYKPAESCALLMARLYRSFGIGLDATADLITEGSHGGLTAALDEVRAELEAEAARLSRTLSALDRYRDECEKAIAGVAEGPEAARFEEVSLPATKYVITIDSGMALDEPERRAIARSWMEKLPEAYFALIIPARAFLGFESLYGKWGFALEAEGLEDSETGIAGMFPAADCLALSFLRQNSGMLTESELEAVRAKFAATGKELAGDVRGRFLEILVDEEGPHYLYRLYFPFYR